MSKDRKLSLSRMLFLSFLSVSLFLVSATTSFASGNLWYDKYVAADNSYGSSLYTLEDSGRLAWGESYILRSYLSMYNTTRNTGWLDKFVTHVDTMLTNVNDWDGDGYDSWTSFGYSPVEVDNDGFETPASGDATRPDQWTRWQSTSSTAYRSNSTNSKYEGNWGLVLKTNGSTWQRLYQNLNDYEPSTKYTLRVRARTNNTDVQGRAYIRDETTDTLLAEIIIPSYPAWEYYEVSFTTPSSSGHTLRLWLGHTDYTVTGGEAYFDNVRVSGNYPYLVHDGMIGVPMAEFVRLIDQTPSLQSSYQSDADTYQDFLEDELIPKWENSSYLGNSWKSLSGTQGTYTQPPNVSTLENGGPGVHLPYNMSHAFTHMLHIMYTVNSNSTYLDRAQKFNTYFKNDLVANGNAWDWDYSDWHGVTEDTAHGAVDIGSVVEMFRHGQIYSGSDIWKFTKTLTDYMWNGSSSSPEVSRYVDGGGSLVYTRTLQNWLEFSQFDIEVWPIAAEQYRSYTPTTAGNMLALSHIVAWDPEKAVNQGFELATYFDSTQPARWVRWQSSSATAYLDSTNKYEGDQAATIKANGTSWQKFFQTWKEWKPNTTYVVTFHGNTDGSAAGGRLAIYNETTNSSLGGQSFFNTSWQQHSFTVTTPSNGTDTLRIYLGNHDYSVTNGKAHFDNVSIKVQGDSF